MEFDKLLKLMVEKGASDLFITAGKPPMLKVNGKLYAAGKTSLSPEQSKELVYGVMNPEQQTMHGTASLSENDPAEHPNNFFDVAEVADGLTLARAFCGLQTGCLFSLSLCLHPYLYLHVHLHLRQSDLDQY